MERNRDFPIYYIIWGFTCFRKSQQMLDADDAFSFMDVRESVNMLLKPPLLSFT
jgi:hypothetical protein